jgi:hypothetical protein
MQAPLSHIIYCSRRINLEEKDVRADMVKKIALE